ncbi:FRG domain-containing protein [Alkalibacterium sp. f15]|uniref:FRG domain-containing protein n=1 Tax=Alkalibacterium sp. f15 TaxID=3414029 RepID=UPI003BF9251B
MHKMDGVDKIKNDGTILINKLSEYMDYVERLPESFSISRGQNRDFPLIPGALRNDERGARKYSRQSIAHFLNEFKVNSHYYMTEPWDVKNDYEWMVHAQHYGIPTKLLDFSKSHIIALMFAVEKAFEEKEENSENGVVWFFDPKILNSIHSNRTDLFLLSDQNLKLDDFDGPVVVQGRKANVRVNAQNGVFLYFQESNPNFVEIIKRNLENTPHKEEDVIRKVVINKSSKKDILVSLFSMGFGFTQVYPELASVSKDILLLEQINEYKKYKKEIEDEE